MSLFKNLNATLATIEEADILVMPRRRSRA